MRSREYRAAVIGCALSPYATMDTIATEPSTSTEAVQNQRDTELIVPADSDVVTNEIGTKKPRFITQIARADDKGNARKVINLAKTEYPDTHHHYSTYIHEVVGENRMERSSDDGEPGDTAGHPMLDILQGSGMTNVTAVVICYFGDIKLGTGGLVRAYSDSVSEYLERVTRMRRVQRALRVVSISAIDAGHIETELRVHGYKIVGTRWGQSVEFSIVVTADGITQLDGEMQALTKGTSEPSTDDGKI